MTRSFSPRKIHLKSWLVPTPHLAIMLATSRLSCCLGTLVLKRPKREKKLSVSELRSSQIQNSDRSYPFDLTLLFRSNSHLPKLSSLSHQMFKGIHQLKDEGKDKRLSKSIIFSHSTDLTFFLQVLNRARPEPQKKKFGH